VSHRVHERYQFLNLLSERYGVHRWGIEPTLLRVRRGSGNAPVMWGRRPTS